MALGLSPKDLENSYKSWNSESKEFVTFEDIHLIYPMLIYKGFDKKIQRYRYTCKHLDYDKKGRAFCQIQGIKPDVCKRYGTEKQEMDMGYKKSVNQEYYPGCAY